MKTARLLCFRRNAVLLLKAAKLSHYQQEAFEASRRFAESPTYPGSIRASTPGDTRFYTGSVETIIPANERHYWRAVIDDPEVQSLIPLRIKFKSNVWVTTGWETRVQVVQVMVSRDSSVQQIVDQILVENQSPYLCTSTIVLSKDGKELDSSQPISFYGIDEFSHIDAIEENDHLLHSEAHRLKDWNEDEITADDAQKSPYKEMGITPQANLAPRYEARPPGVWGKNNYSGMKQTT